jgi:hypothetical protein
MTTLGQMLHSNSTAQPPFSAEKFLAAEEARLKASVDDFAVVLSKAKDDIAKAICAGADADADAYSVHSGVSEDGHKPAYGYLRFLHGSYSPQRDQEWLRPLWNEFLGWAGSEGLRIELVSCLPDRVDGEQVGGCYVQIRARPARGC